MFFGVIFKSHKAINFTIKKSTILIQSKKPWLNDFNFDKFSHPMHQWVWINVGSLGSIHDPWSTLETPVGMKIVCCDPKILIEFYGKMSVFSLIYIVGAQMSLYNILSSFGIPFCHIYVRFGSGFVYDVVCDSIILATYIGMKNEMFFPIPKKKTTVTYELPGISNVGPNIDNAIH